MPGTDADRKHLIDWISKINERHTKLDDQFRDPCNFFVGHALEQIWGVKDFCADPLSNRGEPYMNTGSIDAALSTKATAWRYLGNVANRMGRDNKDLLLRAISLANNGYPVIGIVPNSHIVLLMPQAASSQWKDVKVAQWREGQWAFTVKDKLGAHFGHFAGGPLAHSWISPEAARSHGKVSPFPKIKIYYLKAQPRGWK